jgi:hypothetical protein
MSIGTTLCFDVHLLTFVDHGHDWRRSQEAEPQMGLDESNLMLLRVRKVDQVHQEATGSDYQAFSQMQAAHPRTDGSHGQGERRSQY